MPHAPPTTDTIEPLLQPLTIGRCRLANRIVMAPMSRYFCSGGVPSEEVAAYYARRARSGLGLIITEGAGIPHPRSVDNPGVPHLHGEAALAGWKRLIDAVHREGGLIWPQLWHQGPMWNVEHQAPVAETGIRPSGIWGPADGLISIDLAARERAVPETESMSDTEIQDVINGYAQAAHNAVSAGADGIAIHGAHGYLIDSFLWNFTNRRGDRWGGDEKGRTAFGCAVVRAIRAVIGPDVPIALRLSQFKMQDYRARLADHPDQLERLLGPLADAGVDLFDGSQRFFDTPIFEGSSLNLAGWAKKLTGKLSMTVGGIGLDKGQGAARHIDGSQPSANNLPRVVTRFLDGEFDLVAVGRSILNDADWLGRARRGEAFAAFDPRNLERLA